MDYRTDDYPVFDYEKQALGKSFAFQSENFLQVWSMNRIWGEKLFDTPEISQRSHHEPISFNQTPDQKASMVQPIPISNHQQNLVVSDSMQTCSLTSKEEEKISTALTERQT